MRSVHIEYDPKSRNHVLFNIRSINAIIEFIEEFEIERDLSLQGRKPRVLDVGCGRGELLKELSRSGFECFGLDIDEKCVELSNRYGHIEHCSVGAMDDNFSENFFDIVVLSHVLEHTDNPQDAVERAKNVSSRYILIAVPNLAEPNLLYYSIVRKFFRSLGRKYEPSYINRGHKFGWDPSHLRTFLEFSCGLNIVSWKVDRVVMIPQIIPRLLEYLKLRDFFEVRLLPKLFPFWSHSLIVMCEKS